MRRNWPILQSAPETHPSCCCRPARESTRHTPPRPVIRAARRHYAAGCMQFIRPVRSRPVAVGVAATLHADVVATAYRIALFGAACSNCAGSACGTQALRADDSAGAVVGGPAGVPGRHLRLDCVLVCTARRQAVVLERPGQFTSKPPDRRHSRARAAGQSPSPESEHRRRGDGNRSRARHSRSSSSAHVRQRGGGDRHVAPSTCAGSLRGGAARPDLARGEQASWSRRWLGDATVTRTAISSRWLRHGGRRADPRPDATAPSAALRHRPEPSARRARDTSTTTGAIYQSSGASIR